VSVQRMDALAFLSSGDAAYDIVFLDPPFGAGLWTPLAQALESGARLKSPAWIYVESPADAAPEMPASFELQRENRAGAVRFALYRRSAKLSAP